MSVRVLDAGRKEIAHEATSHCLCGCAVRFGGNAAFCVTFSRERRNRFGGGGSSVINADAPGSEDVDATSDKGSDPEIASEPNAAQAVYVSSGGSDESGHSGCTEGALSPYDSPRRSRQIGRQMDGLVLGLPSYFLVTVN